jgi:hypothetical protein
MMPSQRWLGWGLAWGGPFLLRLRRLMVPSVSTTVRQEETCWLMAQLVTVSIGITANLSTSA